MPTRLTVAFGAGRMHAGQCHRDRKWKFRHRPFLRQELQSHAAGQGGVLGLTNHTHAAGKLLQEAATAGLWAMIIAPICSFEPWEVGR